MALWDAQLVDPHVSVRCQLLQLASERALGHLCLSMLCKIIENGVPLRSRRVRGGHIVPPIGEDHGGLLHELHLALGREVREVAPAFAELLHDARSISELSDALVLRRLLAKLPNKLVVLDGARAVCIATVEHAVRLLAAHRVLPRVWPH
eukprot:scaffold5687_cov132-Isochrysis_galbana.AAC.3